MNKKNKLQNQVHELNHLVYEIGAELENVQNIKNRLGRIAIDANEWKGTEKERFFLSDNNDVLQIINDYLYRVMNEVTERHTKLEELANDVFDVIVKGEQKENTPDSTKNQG